MIDNLQVVGYGIIALAVLLGIGITVLGQLATTVASCPATIGGGTATYNTTSQTCMNTSGSAVNPSTATQTINTINGTYIGTNLVAWIPVVIVLIIGMLFLGVFMVRKGQQA